MPGSKVSPVSVAASVVLGIFVLGGIVIAWKFGAPITDKMTVNRPVVPLSASQNTKELIKKVHVQQDQPVKKGDLLYELETAPFQYAVDQQTAQLEEAKLELDRAYVRASADGFIMNWQAVEGTMTTTVITSAQGAFQDTSRTRVVAVYRQNLVKNVKPGDVVEVAFASFPHHIATGKVDAVLEYTGEGQFLSSGVVPVAASVGSKGFLAVRIVLDDEAFARQLPLGAAGTTAIYTDFAKPFQAISKVVMRIKAWMYYLPA